MSKNSNKTPKPTTPAPSLPESKGPEVSARIVLELLRMPAFAEVIRMLEREHLYRVGLSTEATLEQRALYQVKVQEYEGILGKLRMLMTNARQTQIPSEYLPAVQPTIKK